MLNKLRFDDEFVRHKVLDLIGDLALLGHPIVGHVEAHKAGHALHAALATKLLGSAGPKMAEQCVSQMQTFFGALAWYMHRYPDRAATLLATTDAR